MHKMMLDRRTLAQLLQGNQLAILTFERVLKDTGETLPTAIEEANLLAGAALSVAQANGALLTMLFDALDQLERAPAVTPITAGDDLSPPTIPAAGADDTAPSSHLGTISGQNADQVEFTGGEINGTTIGLATPAAAKFTSLETIGSCNLGDGSEGVGISVRGSGAVGAAFAINVGGVLLLALGNKSAVMGGAFDGSAYLRSSGTLFTSDALQVAGAWACNGKTALGPQSLGPAATDPASTQTLVNNIRTALINSGIGI